MRSLTEIIKSIGHKKFKRNWKTTHCYRGKITGISEYYHGRRFRSSAVHMNITQKLNPEIDLLYDNQLLIFDFPVSLPHDIIGSEAMIEIFAIYNSYYNKGYLMHHIGDENISWSYSCLTREFSKKGMHFYGPDVKK